MLASKLELRLPRKIAACFLLFGVAALVWLSVGAAVVTRRVAESKSESASLRALGEAAERASHGSADLQQVVRDIAAGTGAEHCAVVSPEGIYLAHSKREMVGKGAFERGSATDRWGDTVRLQYLSDDGTLVHEYRTPLAASAENPGSLHLALAKPNLWSYLGAGIRYSPVALLGPIFCLVAGVAFLNRLVRPVAEIEEQLSQVAMSPSVEGCRLRSVATVGSAAVGWNRVVEQRSGPEPGDALARRIRESLKTGRQSRLDTVLNGIPEGLATTDHEGILSYSNLPMRALLELREQDIQDEAAAAEDQPEASAEGENAGGPNLVDRLRHHWRLAEDDPLLAAENQDRSVVTELVREDGGRRRVIRVARHPLHGAGANAHERHVWMIRDVTQQKLAEEMRDQFVDTATHELRTPLANIKAYAETLALADVIDIEQQKQFLNTINSEASRLARFVDDLLSVSSMELGSLSLNKQVTDMARLLGEVMSKVRPQIDDKAQEFEVVLPEKLPELEIDKDKIATVVVNLLGNAVKYTPPGGRVTLRVNVNDHCLDVSVEDTGVGIAESEIPKVFDKFFRSDDPRVQEETGTGLGLALSQEVVRLHGGRIEVESELNKGSTFSMLLPIG